MSRGRLSRGASPMDAMRVLVLAPHPFFESRGTPIAEKMLIESLSAKGSEIEVLTFHLGTDDEVPGARIRRIPNIRWIKEIRPGFSLRKVLCDIVLAISCFRLLRRESFDLIHAVEESSFIALLMKFVYGIPYVYDMDSSLSQQMVEKFSWLRFVKGPMDLFERQAVRESVAVLAVCRSLEDIARSYDGTKLVGRVEDVSFVEPDGADRQPADMANLARPRVLYVGNLEVYQGIDLLLEAFQISHERQPEAQLVVVGGSDEHIDLYRNVAREKGISESVHFLGPRPLDELGSYLAAADVLASPRIKGNNTPMKIYSYLGSGKAILATRLATHTQVLNDDVACLAAPEPQAMAAGLSALLEDSELRRKLGQQGQELAEREYTPAAYDRKLAVFYRQVTGQIRG